MRKAIQAVITPDGPYDVAQLRIGHRVMTVHRFTHGDDTYAHACILRRSRSQAAPSVPRR